MRAIDLFAGAGGSTLGLRAAGYDVTWAANHWPLAVRVHQTNHPEASHVCQDLHQADWRQVPAHELLWASPACQGHSTAATRNGTKPGRCAVSRCTGQAPLAARGTAPAHDALRATAWAAVSAAEVHRPRWLVVENVTEFRDWVLYPAWRQALADLGYEAQELVLDAADLGAPQHRRRLFLVAEQGRRLQLTPPSAQDLVPAHAAVDLSAGTWRRLSDVPAGHRARCEAATARFAREGAALVQAVTGHRGRSLDRPLPTITTKHQMGLVRRTGRTRHYRPLLLSEYAAGMTFPRDYDWCGVGMRDGVKLLGNAVVPLVATWIGQALVAA